MPRIEFDVSDKTYQELLKFGVISSHFAKESPFSPVDLCKAAIVEYLSRFSTEYISDNECIFLLADLQLFIGSGTLKNRIRDYMKEKGIRSKTVIERSGIPKSTLNEILANERQPGLESFFRLLPALGYPRLTDIFYRDSISE